MRIGKCILVLLMAILLTTAVACGSEEAAPTPSPAPTPTEVPTPTPVPNLPDLKISNVTFDPAVGCEGSLVQVAVTIQNQGTLLSPACYWSWQLYQGSINQLNTLPSLPPGGTIVVHTVVTPADDITGTFNTTAIVDSMSGVAEINESNNDFNQPMTVVTCDPQASYNSDKSKIQAALNVYIGSHNGSFPETNYSIQLNYPSGTYHIIDICSLLGTGNMLQEVPVSCVNSSFNNCESNSCVCKQNAHYVWLLDGAGNVLSSCIGSGCDTDFSDGYQGIWP